MVTSSVDSIIRLWDHEGNVTKAMKDHKEMTNTARWNKEGNIIATGGYDDSVMSRSRC
jgi:WD40 repeat protein